MSVVLRAIEIIGEDEIIAIVTLGICDDNADAIAELLDQRYAALGLGFELIDVAKEYAEIKAVDENDPDPVGLIAPNWAGCRVHVVRIRLVRMPRAIKAVTIRARGAFINKDAVVMFPAEPIMIECVPLPGATIHAMMRLLAPYAKVAGVTRETWHPSYRTAMYISMHEDGGSTFLYVDDPDTTTTAALYAAHGI